MKLDLNIAIVDDSIKAWAFHPGKGKRYFRYFATEGRVFLDLPGVRLSPDLIKDESSLRRNIVMSRKIHDYFRKNISGKEPSRNSNDYPADKTRGIDHIVTSTKRFVSEIDKGDLILVSPRTQYERILFGLAEEKFNPRDTVVIDPFLKDPFSTRSVSWLPSSVTKRELPDQLALKLENRHTIIQLTGLQREQALAAAYKDYITASVSKINIECPLYKGKNPLETVEVQEMMSFFTAIFFALENGTIHEIQNKSFEDIARNYYEGGLITHIEKEFHSPGRFIVHGTAALGLFLSACFAMSSLGRFDADAANNLTITNSQSNVDNGYNKRTFDLIQSAANSISAKTLKECNEAAKLAKDNLGVKTSTKVSK